MRRLRKKRNFLIAQRLDITSSLRRIENVPVQHLSLRAVSTLNTFLRMKLLVYTIMMINLVLSQSAQAAQFCSAGDNASALQRLPAETLAQTRQSKCRRIEGRASHYAEYFNGRPTASGERYSSAKLTAAHRTLPFGTKVLVSSKGREVTVTINDRGPFVKGREIDLSSAAAKQLQIKGVEPVEIEVCDEPSRET